ncbi:putative DNA polymerase zeta catalytic subunit [Leptomonas seymouri]|uniref:DNA-directed DNA polymerase n=1 Tax=Leptomonas seymouri TaxID=5684 RepID=A0A0N0P4S6_LEPSE|nr:putative DNA polymerase zeta catalytic subunit [Leptomonas seymouri]|eukprot:KPI85649.1 putative DNA polymerase zeta catalytic subunit [Leptomonas seymouri]
MYFQVVTISHSLERPQEELGDATLSPVFRRVSLRCPVLHLFGYVHIPSADTSPHAAPTSSAAAVGSLDRNSGGLHGHSVEPLATLLERATSDGTPKAPPSSSFTGAQRHESLGLTSPSPKLAARSARVVKPSEECEQAATLHNSESVDLALANAGGFSREAVRSSTLLRSRYTQRRACLHVHGVYPSLLLPQYDRSVSADQLAAQLETVVIRLLSKQGVAVAGQQLVHDARIVHRYNVYGYRPHAYAFYLVELIDPNMLQRVVDILQNTRDVGGRQWQLYDAHMKYHTKFMVRWHINGVAPFALPVQRCHVRLPTAVEMRPHFAPFFSDGRSSLDKGTRLKLSFEEHRRRHDQSGDCHEGLGGSQHAGLHFLRVWRPDELGRLTTAEVEMDVCARDLRESDDGDPTAVDGGPRASSKDKGEGDAAPRSSASAGDNLSYTRRVIRQYFKEHGVPDALRVADTIAMERHLQATGPLSCVPDKGSASAPATLMRYGYVTQIQRADPAVRWMRHRMLEYLEQRCASAAAAASVLVEATSANPPKWEAGDGGPMEPLPPSSDALLHCATVPLGGVVRMATAEQLREQRAVRAQMVAEYSKPGGRDRQGHDHRRHATEQADAGGRALVPAQTGMGAGAILAGDTVLPNFLGYGASRHHDSNSGKTSGDVRYIGFSSDSLQLSSSQDTPPQPLVNAVPAWAARKTETTSGLDAVPQAWLRGISVEDIKEVEMASTQDLMAALAARSSASLMAAEADRQPSVPELPMQQSAEQANGRAESKGEEGVAVRDTACSSSVPLSKQLIKPKLFSLERAAPLMLKRAAEATAPAPVLGASNVVEYKRAASQASSSPSSASSSWSLGSSPIRGEGEDTVAVLTGARKGRCSQAKSSLDTPLNAIAHKTQLPLQVAELASAERLPAQPEPQPPGLSRGNDDDEGPQRDLLTQNLRPLSAASHHPLPHDDLEERCSSARPSLRCLSGGMCAAAGCTPLLFSSSEEGDQRRRREADAARSALCCSSPTAWRHAATQHAVGDCVAFVQVRQPHRQEQRAPNTSTLHEVDDAAVCEVLAVARVAKLSTDTVDLQWFVTLGETHLAEEEATLVRRGAWVRRRRSMNVPLTPRNRRACLSDDPFRLGEMLLSDAVDTVPASVLEAAPQSALIYAAAHSAPTQRLPVEHHALDSSVGVANGPLTTHKAPYQMLQCESQGRAVYVWPVHCYVDFHAYESCDSNGQHQPSGLPPLRITCRYEYVMQARVLTAAAPDLFSSSTARSGPRPPASRDRFFAETPARRLRSSAARTEAPHAHERLSEEGEDVLPRSSGSRVWRRSSMQRRSTRVLFTQPERLTPFGGGDSDLDGGGGCVPLSSTARLGMGGASGGSELGISERGEGDAQQAPTLDKGDAEEGEGEDTLLFPSSPSSSNSSVDTAPRQRWGMRAESRKRICLEAVGPRRSPSEHPSQHQARRSQLLQRDGETGVAAPHSHPHGPKRYRVSTLLMPTLSFMVGAVRVQRSVHAGTRRGAEEAPDQEQRRWRRPSAALEAEGAQEKRKSGVVMGPAAPFECARFSGDVGRLGGTLKDAQPDHDITCPNEVVNEEAEGDVLIQSFASSSSPTQYTVRDTADVVRDTPTSPSSVLSVHTDAASEASSVEAVGAVTASQHTFLQLFQHPSATGKAQRMRGTVLQAGGSLCSAVDSVPRLFCVTASSNSGGERANRFLSPQSRSPQHMFANSDVRMRVSAVTWPYMAPTAPGEMNSEGKLHYERVEEPAKLSKTATHLSPSTAEGKAATVASDAAPLARAKAPAFHEKKSASRAPRLSLSSTQQPQHYLQCALRVQYIEVLLNRRPGEARMSTSDVLAVALGQASTATDSSIGVRIFCVASAHTVKEVGVRKTRPTAAASTSLPELRLHGLCTPVHVVTVPDEAALLACVQVEIAAYDPDLLLSWEGCKYGLGFLALRYRAVLQRSLAADLSRMQPHHGYQPRPAPQSPHAEVHPTAKAIDVDSGGSGGGFSHAAGSVMPDPGHLDVPQEASETAPDEAHVVCSTTDGTLREASRRSALPAAPPLMVQQAPSSASSSVSSAVLNDFDRDAYNEDDADDVDAQGGGGAHAGFWAPNGGGTVRAGGWHPKGKSDGLQQQQRQWRRGGERAGASAAATTAAGDSAAAVAAYSKRFGAGVHITGRICASLGRSLRKDVKMPSYSLPVVHAELFGQPLPYFTDTYLADLFDSTADPGDRQAVLRYLTTRVVAPHRIACKLHWFTKLMEFSRMYGVLAEEVLTRGSQFRVEATLLRFAYRAKYAMLSPSLLQVHRQPRIECIPLVMQPKADLYRREDPIVVLDFRSLYPSIIIAYNLCYSTCLGMVQPTAHGRLGVLPNFKQSDSLLAELLPDDGIQRGSVVFTPNGAMFADPGTRVGLLPQMVQAVLDTRFEVQAALRHIAGPTGDTAMQQRLQEQQLALKMLANVTYGYTAASFTGRMPCVDLAEAIVSLGRQTLERAVALIHSTAAWKAEVVYGDTDSLFVRLHGRTLPEAFAIGQQMADAVTESNPSPIRLQFEKIVSPCLLLVKKRYAGYMWTSPTQPSPTFFAKGIEVVRRDQCPATVRIVRRMLRLLFDGCSAATLKHAYYSEMEKLVSGTVNPLHCIFRCAVRLDRYGHSGSGHLPLAARFALKQMEQDVAETPYWGERLSYVVVRSTRSIDNLTDQVLHPAHLLYLQDTHSLDTSYYITRHINSSLDRMFYLVGISVAQWYRLMPRRRTAHAALLNLPTFMKAQERLEKAPAGSHPPSAPPPLPAFISAPQHRRRIESCDAAQGDQLRLVAQLALQMQQLLREATNPLLEHRRGARRPTAVELIGTEDETRHSAHLPSPSPVDVDDSARSTVHELVDVEQLMATQRARSSAAVATAAEEEIKQSHVALPPHPPLRRQRDSDVNAGKRSITLDAFYPRTLCVVCEKAVVSLDDVRRQREVLQRFDRTLGDRASEAEAGDGGGAGRGPVACKRGGTHAEAAGGMQPDVRAASPSRPLFLPPICTRCWSDPSLLFLQVQERCRRLGRQLATLQHICANCIGSGGDWGPPAQALYETLTPDMEDMDAFSSVQMGNCRHTNAAQPYSVGSVSRHLLAAAQLSPRGVPQGCVSIDCAVGFEKRWVTAQWQQWQALQQFLWRVL